MRLFGVNEVPERELEHELEAGFNLSNEQRKKVMQPVVEAIVA